MKKYFLIVDVETSGFPKDWNASIENLNNWPPILEIGWQIYENSKDNLITEKSFLIQQDQEVPSEIVDITGITQEETKEEGVSINKALNYFFNAVQPQSTLAILINMMQIIYGIGLFIILIGIIISVNTPKYKEDIDQVIYAFDYQIEQIERSMRQHFKISVQQAIYELEKAKHFLADLINFIDPDS